MRNSHGVALGLVVLALGAGFHRPVETSSSDLEPPHVVSCDPAEGSEDLAAESIGVIRCTFSEPMNRAAGTVELTPSHPLGEVEWSDGGLTAQWVPISPLGSDRYYQAVLEGFRDRAGNALDGEPYLADGALDFSTAP